MKKENCTTCIKCTYSNALDFSVVFYNTIKSYGKSISINVVDFIPFFLWFLSLFSRFSPFFYYLIYFLIHRNALCTGNRMGRREQREKQTNTIMFSKFFFGVYEF